MKQFMKKLEGLLEIGGIRKDASLIIISAAALLLSLFKINLDLPFDIAWAAILLCGIPIVLEAVIGLVTEFDITADVLVALALIASICIGEYFAAGEVALIMQLGGLLEELTVARARAGIEKLVHLTPQTARVIRDGTETIIPAEEVQLGDILKVVPGETIPVDGVLIAGQSSVNQAVMTGESLPVDKQVGDEVSSGTVNQFGAFEMKATRVGEDSSIQRMIRLVQSADASKAKIVNLADRWAVWVVIIALTSAALTWLITGQIIRAVTILVVFCPCSLVLATPTAIMAGIGNVTKHGFLVREGDALERLASVQKIMFDKTGTLTNGTPQVISVRSIEGGISDQEIFHLIASVENQSEHPIGKAIAAGYRTSGKPLAPVMEFRMLTGKGVSGLIDGRQIIAGNEKLFHEYDADYPEAFRDAEKEAISEGATVIFAALDRKPVGYVLLSDTLRENAGSMIEGIRGMSVEPVLLTGDHGNTAETIAKAVGIKEYHADLLPEDKLKFIEENQPACMVGDGVNDAPALKLSHVGIAMGGIGSDIAVDAADIVLVDDEVKELPHLLALSKKMMRTIKVNLAFSMTLNFVAIMLAITGILNPVIGALVHNAGSVLVIINSALLLRWRKNK